jgi:hypothetical protein
MQKWYVVFGGYVEIFCQVDISVSYTSWVGNAPASRRRLHVPLFCASIAEYEKGKKGKY